VQEDPTSTERRLIGVQCLKRRPISSRGQRTAWRFAAAKAVLFRGLAPRCARSHSKATGQILISRNSVGRSTSACVGSLCSKVANVETPSRSLAHINFAPGSQRRGSFYMRAGNEWALRPCESITIVKSGSLPPALGDATKNMVALARAPSLSPVPKGRGFFMCCRKRFGRPAAHRRSPRSFASYEFQSILATSRSLAGTPLFFRTDSSSSKVVTLRTPKSFRIFSTKSPADE
jgi:hypothetical protein